jgi:nucleoside-diphosphate-sugar epimerase
MSGLKCGITGASGYVGSCIASYLRSKGIEVVELGRSGSGPTHFSLEEPVDAKGLEGLDFLVHCAYDFKSKRWDDIKRVNVDGSTRLLQAAGKAGVKAVFISTMSAFNGCTSNYGRAKLEIEQEAKRTGAFVIRPGLVYGRSARSVVGKMRAFIARFPVIPDMDTGGRKLYMCHCEDLANLVYLICVGKAVSGPTPIIAANETGFSFREMIEILAKAAGKKVMFLPLPGGLLSLGLRTAEKIGLNQGIRSDSLVSLMNLDPNPDFAFVRKTGASFRGFSVETLD